MGLYLCYENGLGPQKCTRVWLREERRRRAAMSREVVVQRERERPEGRCRRTDVEGEEREVVKLLSRQ